MTAKQRTLLLVDDEADIRDILESYLEALGLKILHAENGKSALKILDNPESKVDAIFSDIAMPELNGLGLLSEVMLKHQDIPVVIVSAFGDRENLLEALRLGASDFLEKPFTEDMVLTIAKRVLEIGASKRALGRLASEEGEGVSNVSRIFDMHKERRKIAVLSKKLNMESRRKKRAR